LRDKSYQDQPGFILRSGMKIGIPTTYVRGNKIIKDRTVVGKIIKVSEKKSNKIKLFKKSELGDLDIGSKIDISDTKSGIVIDIIKKEVEGKKKKSKRSFYVVKIIDDLEKQRYILAEFNMEDSEIVYIDPNEDHSHYSIIEFINNDPDKGILLDQNENIRLRKRYVTGSEIILFEKHTGKYYNGTVSDVLENPMNDREMGILQGGKKYRIQIQKPVKKILEIQHKTLDFEDGTIVKVFENNIILYIGIVAKTNLNKKGKGVLLETYYRHIPINLAHYTAITNIKGMVTSKRTYEDIPANRKYAVKKSKTLKDGYQYVYATKSQPKHELYDKYSIGNYIQYKGKGEGVIIDKGRNGVTVYSFNKNSNISLSFDDIIKVLSKRPSFDKEKFTKTDLSIGKIYISPLDDKSRKYIYNVFRDVIYRAMLGVRDQEVGEIAELEEKIRKITKKLDNMKFKNTYKFLVYVSRYITYLDNSAIGRYCNIFKAKLRSGFYNLSNLLDLNEAHFIPELYANPVLIHGDLNDAEQMIRSQIKYTASDLGYQLLKISDISRNISVPISNPYVNIGKYIFDPKTLCKEDNVTDENIIICINGIDEEDTEHHFTTIQTLLKLKKNPATGKPINKKALEKLEKLVKPKSPYKSPPKQKSPSKEKSVKKNKTPPKPKKSWADIIEQDEQEKEKSSSPGRLSKQQVNSYLDYVKKNNINPMTNIDVEIKNITRSTGLSKIQQIEIKTNSQYYEKKYKVVINLPSKAIVLRYLKYTQQKKYDPLTIIAKEQKQIERDTGIDMKTQDRIRMNHEEISAIYNISIIPLRRPEFDEFAFNEFVKEAFANEKENEIGAYMVEDEYFLKSDEQSIKNRMEIFEDWKSAKMKLLKKNYDKMYK
jgi:hypothetical protein